MFYTEKKHETASLSCETFIAMFVPPLEPGCTAAMTLNSNMATLNVKRSERRSAEAIELFAKQQQKEAADRLSSVVAGVTALGPHLESPAIVGFRDDTLRTSDVSVAQGLLTQLATIQGPLAESLISALTARLAEVAAAEATSSEATFAVSRADDGWQAAYRQVNIALEAARAALEAAKFELPVRRRVRRSADELALVLAKRQARIERIRAKQAAETAAVVAETSRIRSSMTAENTETSGTEVAA